MTWRAILMNLPEAERLPAALDMLADALGEGDQWRIWRAALGLSPQAAQVLAVLHARHGQTVPYEALIYSVDLMRGAYSDGLTKGVLSVELNRIRNAAKKHGLGPDILVTDWSIGVALNLKYACAIERLEGRGRARLRLDAPPLPVDPAPRADPEIRLWAKWSADEIRALKTLLRLGTPIETIAVALRRSRAAIAEQRTKIRAR